MMRSGIFLLCKGNAGDLGNSPSLNLEWKNKLQLCSISVSEEVALWD